MKYLETENIELKEKLTDDIEKEVVSFLNSHSGTIYIGVNKNGDITGVEDYDGVSIKITERLKNNIFPSVIGLFDIRVLEEEGKKYISITVASGIEKPYYVKKYGMSSKGC